jgi:hypothetical protein
MQERRATQGEAPQRSMPEEGGRSAPSAADGSNTAAGVGSGQRGNERREQPAAAR